jgi:hypothetical protein
MVVSAKELFVYWAISWANSRLLLPEIIFIGGYVYILIKISIKT